MTKRSLQQIEETLRARLAEAGSKDLDNDGVPDEIQQRSAPGLNPYDPLNIGGKGTGFNIDIGLGGTGRGGSGRPSVWRGPGGEKMATPKALQKPRVTPDEARAAAAERKRAEELLTGQTPKEGPKVWRQGGSEKGQSLPPGQYVDKSGIKRNADGTPVPTVLQVKPGAAQSGPKFDPNQKYDTGLERKPGPGTREIWHTKPQKQPKSLKPEELAARERRSQQRLTPDLKDKRERRAGYASVGGHAAALAALLYAQSQKEKEAGGAEPTGSKADADSQAASQPVSVELLSPSANNSGSSDVDLPTVTTQPRSDAGSVAEPESGSMSGRIISEPRKQVPDTELKSLPAVTVTAEPSGGAAKPDPNTKKPVEKPAEKPQARPVEKPVEKPAEKPAERPAEKPAEKPQARPDSGNQEKPGAGPSDKEGPGTKTSPGGTGEKPGDRAGPGTGTGTEVYKEPQYRNRGTMTQLPEQQLSATQARLLEKYNNFLQEDSAVYEERQDPRQVIEQYLGKRLSNSEYSAFLRAVGAESGRQPLERAHIASVILNRARAARGDIIGVLNTPSQFQAITGPKGYQGTAFNPYYSNARSIIPGIDQEIASTLELVKPGLTHFSAADPAAYKDVGGMKKYREVMKMYSKDSNRSRVYASVFGNLGPVPYNPNANPMVKREQKLGDKFRDPYAGLVEPTNIARAEPSGGAAKPVPSGKKPTDTGKQEKTTKPGYYTVGDSHGEGIAVYGKGKDGPNWINKSKVGASVVDKDQFKTHMANIESIPAGSVVTISGGANDIARSNHQAIVDNLNKLIAAAKAKGHKVVYVLPTESPDPAKKEQREALRQTILNGVKDVPIVDLGMASKTDKQQVHLDSKGYNRIAKNISDMFVPGVDASKTSSGKPVGTQVLPDWSKYKYGDLGPLVKNDQGEWTTVDGQRSATDPKFIADIEKLDNYTPPETFLDKVQRSLPPFLGGKGELVSQVFGDKKKSAAPAAPEPVAPPAATDKQPSKDSGSGDWFEKLYGIDKAKEYVRAQKAETNKKEQERVRKSLGLAPGEEIVDIPLTKEPPKEVSPEKIKVIGEPSGETRPIPPGTALGPAKQSVSVPPPEAKAQPAKAEKPAVSKDVTALLQKDQVGIKQARRELSDFEKAFAAARARGDKEFTWNKKDGKPYQVATNLKGEKSPAKVSNVAAADNSMKQIMSKSLSPDQSLDSGEKLIDVPKITNTGAIDRFNLPAELPQEPKPSEIQQALKDFEREQAALDTDKEIANLDDLVDKKDEKSSSTGTFNESINTKSDVELHNLLKLAGRIK